MIESRLDGKSKDIINENISYFYEICPDIFTEDKIDCKKLKLFLGENIDDSHEMYSFTWPGKIKAIKESQKQSNGTLRPFKDESVNWKNTQNLYIEGDNLEVLKLLQKGYYNKIKAIYIDPPYNTGKDFIYPDDYRDNLENYLKISGQLNGSDEESSGVVLTSNPETAGRYHSNWLSMMYSRLKLARNLLSNEGLIFISIDDNECSNLIKVCDEIFGEDNFIANFIWRSKTGGAGDASNITVDTEYILAYAKNINLVSVNKLKVKRQFKFKDNHYETRGAFNIRNLDESGIRYTESLDFEIRRVNDLLYVGNESFKIWEDSFLNEIPENFSIVPGGKSNHLKKYTWRWSKPKIINGIRNGYLAFKKNTKGDIKLVQKNYEFFNTSTEQRIEEHKIPFRNIIDFTNTSDGTKDLKNIFGEKKYFDYPKPLKLIKHFMDISLNENDIILDFFSGSATTANALLEFNSENFKNNRFILVQIPEETKEDSNAYKDGYKTICDIGKERIRRAGKKIVEETGKKDLDIGFKVFKLSSSNIEKWDPDYKNIQQSLTSENIKEGRSNEDLIYEIMVKYGIDLNLPIEQFNNIYSIGFGALVICLENNVTKDITNDILKFTKKSSTSRVVFKDSGFASDADKTNIKEILKTNKINEFITI